MRNLTLGWRLGLSFGALILLMGVLGSLAVWRMHLAATVSTDLSAKYVPEVHVAQDVALGAWAASFNIRSYALTGDENFLRKGRKGIADLKEHLKAADELANKFPDLVALRQGAIDAKAAVGTFEGYTDRMEAERNNLKAQAVLLNGAGQGFMQNCEELMASQEQQLGAEIAEKADHHPDMLINYTRVTFICSTHDAGGVTEKDFALADEIERAFAAHPG